MKKDKPKLINTNDYNMCLIEAVENYGMSLVNAQIYAAHVIHKEYEMMLVFAKAKELIASEIERLAKEKKAKQIGKK